MKLPDSAKWVEACATEVASLVENWKGVQHVLRYLQGTSGEGLCYKKGVFAQASSSCPLEQLSAGSPNSSAMPALSPAKASIWPSPWQDRKPIFLRQLQLQMHGDAAVPTPVRVYLDSQPALDLVNNPVYHGRSRQVLAKYHFVRDRVHSEKEMVLEKISAGQMGADMLTKHASVGVVRYNKKLAGMM